MLFLKLMRLIQKIFLIFFLISVISCNFAPEPSKEWTLMFYMGGDSDNIEGCLLDNIWQMKVGFSGGCNVIVLFDGNKASNAYNASLGVEYNTLYERAFGEYFTGTRIYQFDENGPRRLYGNDLFPELKTGEEVSLNTGDVEILQKFVNFSQNKFKTKHYGLFIGSHGDGCTNTYYNESEEILQNIVIDWNNPTTNGDMLSLTELGTLTSQRPIDVFAMDSCYMSCVEIFYEIIKADNLGVKYFVATPTEQGIFGWYYKDILRFFCPEWHETVSPLDLVQFMSQAYYNYIFNNPVKWQKLTNYIPWQCITVIDGRKILELKAAIDDFAIALHSNNNDFQRLYNAIYGANINYLDINSNEDVLYYFNPLLYSLSEDNLSALLEAYPYFDIYDLAMRLSYTLTCSKETREKATALCEICDEAVIDSFAGSNYPRVQPGKTGISIFFPKNTTAFEIHCNYDKLLFSQYNNENLPISSEDTTPENWYELLKINLEILENKENLED